MYSRCSLTDGYSREVYGGAGQARSPLVAVHSDSHQVGGERSEVTEHDSLVFCEADHLAAEVTAVLWPVENLISPDIVAGNRYLCNGKANT